MGAARPGPGEVNDAEARPLDLESHVVVVDASCDGASRTPVESMALGEFAQQLLGQMRGLSVAQLSPTRHVVEDT